MCEASEKACALFRQGYNCAQAVTAAFAEEFGMSQETALRFSEGMGAGMGRLRLTCGAVSAMALLAGLKLSSGKPNDLENRKKVYAVVQEMTKAFQEKNGSLICSELLGAAKPKDNSTQPEARTETYYKKRPCVGCVADCAEIVEQYLLGETSSS